LMGKALEISL